jgi:hypothetical protein
MGAGVPTVRDDGDGGGPLRDAAGAQHHDQPGGAGDQGEARRRGAGELRRGAALLTARGAQVCALQSPRLHGGVGQRAQVEPCMPNKTKRYISST